MKFISLILWLTQLPVLAVWSPPSTNQYAWNGNVGIPGGIPNRTTVFSTRSVGATAAQINSDIANCPSNQVVFLNSGTYSSMGSIAFGNAKGVTLRGATNANGTPSTILVMSSGAFIGSNPAGLDWSGSANNLASGYTGGSTSIVFSGTPDTQVSVGNLIKISVADDAICFSDDAPGRNRYSAHQVLSKSGTTVTFRPPLPMTLSATDTPQVGWLNGGPGCQMSGIENLDIRMNGADDGFDGWGCYAFWVKNCCFSNIVNDGVFLYASANCEVRHSYIHHANGTPNNSDGYGIYLYKGTSFTLVEDNIFEKTFMDYWQSFGCAGNVFLYNFNTNSTAQGSVVQVPAIRSNHGATPIMQLYEGNIGEQFSTDGYHGNDLFATLFRNWFHGLSTTGTGNRIMVNAMRGSYYYVVAGNILGNAGWSGPGTFNYEMSGEPGYVEQSVIYRLGYPNTFNNSLASGDVTPPWPTQPTTIYPDTNVAFTIMRHGNFDYKNNAIVNQVGQDATLPSGIFYASKPDYFGLLQWPPFDTSNPSITNPTNIPAGYRYVLGADPPAGFSSASSTTLGTGTIRVGSGTIRFGQ